MISAFICLKKNRYEASCWEGMVVLTNEYWKLSLSSVLRVGAFLSQTEGGTKYFYLILKIAHFVPHWIQVSSVYLGVGELILGNNRILGTPSSQHLFPGGDFFHSLLVSQKGRDMQKAEQLGQYVTIKGAAKHLGIDRQAMYKRVVRRQIPTMKVGPVLMVRLEDVAR